MGAEAAHTGLHYDPRGYAQNWRDNLFPGLPLEQIELDLGAGAGSELSGKFCAAHSSAALAVNSFGPWRLDPDSLQLCGSFGFRSLRFEVKVPTGLGGTPPHLDLIAEGNSIVAVESKCTEWMTPKPAFFNASYDRLLQTHGHSPWFEQMLQLRDSPDRYQFLDAAQLVKHAFGLMKHYGSRRVQLAYLFWEPQNAEAWPDCRRHRAEAEDLSSKVQASNIQLVPLSYSELWMNWQWQDCPPLHLPYLIQRYICPA